MKANSQVKPESNSAGLLSASPSRSANCGRHSGRRILSGFSNLISRSPARPTRDSGALESRVQPGLRQLLARPIRANGFSGIELLVVLAVIGVLLSAVANYFGLFSKSKAIVGANSDIQAIAKIQDCYKSDPAFTGLSGDKVINKCDAYVTRLAGTGTTITSANEWGGVRTFSVISVNGGTDNAFNITEPGLPYKACKSFVETVWPTASSISVTASGGSSTVVKATANVQYAGDAVSAACGTTDGATVVLTSGKGGY